MYLCSQKQVRMKAVKISKLLNALSYIGLFGVIVYYFFVKFERVEYMAFALLGVCILKMLSSSLKASFFEKEYTKLKDDNEFMQRRIDELVKEKESNK